eukprot:m.297493 g.297493  ORF g.297493 m.297493 type:complete len:1412 (-) comp19528_c0_seq10:93-4328(-)
MSFMSKGSSTMSSTTSLFEDEDGLPRVPDEQWKTLTFNKRRRVGRQSSKGSLLRLREEDEDEEDEGPQRRPTVAEAAAAVENAHNAANHGQHRSSGGAPSPRRQGNILRLQKLLMQQSVPSERVPQTNFSNTAADANASAGPAGGGLSSAALGGSVPVPRGKPLGPVSSPLGTNLAMLPDDFLLTVLRRRAEEQPTLLAFGCLGWSAVPACSLTNKALYDKAFRLAQALVGRHRVQPKAVVALMFSRNSPSSIINFVIGLFACMLAGAVPMACDADAAFSVGWQYGFTLSCYDVAIVLSDRQCKKKTKGNLPKDWPSMVWVSVDKYKTGKRSVVLPVFSEADQANQPAILSFSSFDGVSVEGTLVTHGAIVAQAKALHQCHQLQPNEILMVTVAPFWGPGLVHGVLYAMWAGAVSMFVPRATMHAQELLWLQAASNFPASLVVTSVSALHRSLAVADEHTNYRLRYLKQILVPDSLPNYKTIGRFCARFQGHGIEPNVVSTAAFSSSCLNVAMRSPELPGRIVDVSQAALSHGVIRPPADNEDTVTIADSGVVLPGSTLLVARQDDPSQLCQADQAGELLISSTTCAREFYRFQGRSTKVFGRKYSGIPGSFVRTGLYGFIMGEEGPGRSSKRVYITGTVAEAIWLRGRVVHSNHIAQTVASVTNSLLDLDFFSSHIASFTIPVFHEERLVVVVDVLSDTAPDNEVSGWCDVVTKSISTYVGIQPFALLCVAENSLPRKIDGRPDVGAVKQQFLRGALKPTYVNLNPHACIDNLPVTTARNIQAVDTAAAALRKPTVRAKRVAGLGAAADNPLAQLAAAVTGGATADDLTFLQGPELQHQLQWASFSQRLLAFDESKAPGFRFNFLGDKGDEAELSGPALVKRVRRMAYFLREKVGLRPGKRVALVFHPGQSLTVAFHACLFAGLIPSPVRAPVDRAEAAATSSIVLAFKADIVLTTERLCKLLKKTARRNAWPVVHLVESAGSKELLDAFEPQPDDVCFVQYTVSPSGSVLGLQKTHSAVLALCASLRDVHSLDEQSRIACCVDPFDGLGLVFWLFVGVYCGCQTIAMSQELGLPEAGSSSWFHAITRFQATMTVVTMLPVMACVESLFEQPLDDVDFSSLQRCCVLCAGRPIEQYLSAFAKGFQRLQLRESALCTMLDSVSSSGVCCWLGPATNKNGKFFVSTAKFKADQIQLMERGSVDSIPILASGKLLPTVKVAIIDPGSGRLAAPDMVGEVYVSSPFSPHCFDGSSAKAQQWTESFLRCRLADDPDTTYVRTGLMGFAQDAALYVTGSNREDFFVRGFRHNPVDLETSIERIHPKLVLGGTSVFSFRELCVVVAELEDVSDGLDLAPLITVALLNEHAVIADVILFFNPGEIPVDPKGSKERLRLRDAFAAGVLRPSNVIITKRL